MNLVHYVNFRTCGRWNSHFQNFGRIKKYLDICFFPKRDRPSRSILPSFLLILSMRESSLSFWSILSGSNKSASISQESGLSSIQQRCKAADLKLMLGLQYEFQTRSVFRSGSFSLLLLLLISWHQTPLNVSGVELARMTTE